MTNRYAPVILYYAHMIAYTMIIASLKFPF